MRHALLTRGPRHRRRRRRRGGWGTTAGVFAAIAIAAYWYIVFGIVEPPHGGPPPPPPTPAATAPTDVVAPKPVEAPPPKPTITAESIHRTAKGMVARGVRWDGGYAVLRFPGGDLPADRGANVDILIRALRGANIDLQVLIHADRVAHPERYPLQRWKRSRPDPNVDHRRLANVWAFLNRYALRLDASVSPKALADYLPGDVVFWGANELPNHVGIVDDRRDDTGVPYVVDLHREEGTISDQHLLNRWPVMGHFRIEVDRLPTPLSLSQEGTAAGGTP